MAGKREGAGRCRAKSTVAPVMCGGLVCVLTAVFTIGIGTASVSAGPVIIGKKKNTDFNSGGKCEVTPATADFWISKTVALQRLKLAYEKAITDMSALTSKDFHHKGGSVGDYWRTQAINDVKNSGAELLAKAETYAGRLIKSCDVCGLLENWNKLLDVARVQDPLQFSRYTNKNIKIIKYETVTNSDGKFKEFRVASDVTGSIALSTLTEEQVSGKDVNGVPLSDSAIVAADRFLLLNGLKSTVVSNPVTDDATKCQANLGGKIPTAKNCAPFMYQQYINWYSDEVVKRLYAAKPAGSTKSMMKKLKSLPTYLSDCPSNLFRNLGELRRFE